jgi:hypothetical protein
MCIIHIIIIGGDDQIISDHLEKCDCAVEISTTLPLLTLVTRRQLDPSLTTNAPRPPTQTAENKKIKNSATEKTINHHNYITLCRMII